MEAIVEPIECKEACWCYWRWPARNTRHS